ncbi:MAG: hypothetical protein KDA79_04580 [Planctomycetaceae bacterium]|nr:hypothetical protein [Planctomycetaceae bacterium]
MTEIASKKLLKAADLRRADEGQVPVAFNVEDLHQRCELHLEKVREQTQQMIRKAHAEAAELHQAAVRKGREEGLAQGLAEADAKIEARSTELAARLSGEQLQTIVPALNELARQLQLEREQWRAEWETGAVRMSIAVAGRIVRHQIAADPDLARESVTAALELVAGVPQLKIHFHPDDLATLGPFASTLLSGMSASTEVEMVATPDMERGGCLIETQHGEIDARLETQLNRIADELLQRSI